MLSIKLSTMDTWDSAVADELEPLLMEVMNGWCSKSVVDIVSSDWIVGSSSNVNEMLVEVFAILHWPTLLPTPATTLRGHDTNQYSTPVRSVGFFNKENCFFFTTAFAIVLPLNGAPSF